MFKRTKSKILAMIAGLLLISGTVAQPLSAQEADETAIDVTFTFLNNYVLRGQSFTKDYQAQGSSMAFLLYFQPDIYFQLSNGWWFDIWGSAQLGNKSPFGDDGSPAGGIDYFDEVDFAFGYSGSSRIGDVSVGFLTYAYPNPKYTSASDLDLSFQFAGPDSPQLSFYWLHSLIASGNFSANGKAGRNYLAIKFSDSWDIANESTFGLHWALGYHILPSVCVYETAQEFIPDTDVTDDKNRIGGTGANSYSGGCRKEVKADAATGTIAVPAQRPVAIQGFSHFDIGISLSKDFFTWSITAIYRYRPGLFESGANYNADGTGIDASPNAYFGAALDRPNGDGKQGRLQNLIGVTSIAFNFGF